MGLARLARKVGGRILFLDLGRHVGHDAGECRIGLPVRAVRCTPQRQRNRLRIIGERQRDAADPRRRRRALAANRVCVVEQEVADADLDGGVAPAALIAPLQRAERRDDLGGAFVVHRVADEVGRRGFLAQHLEVPAQFRVKDPHDRGVSALDVRRRARRQAPHPQERQEDETGGQ